MRKLRSLPQLLVVLISLAAASTGCRKGGDSGGSSGPKPGTDGGAGTASGRTDLKIADWEPKSLDPAGLKDAPGVAIALNLFEGLLARDAAGRPVPGQAERCDVSTDGLVYTCTLREGLTWSDGSPLHAEAFVWAYRHALSPDTGNEQIAMLHPLKGAEALSTKAGTDPTTLGVRADGPRKVVLELERPHARFRNLLATSFFLPVPKQAFERHGKQWIRPEHFVGNGPYVLAFHKHGERMVLKKNPRYWDAENVAIETVTYRFTTDMKDGSRWYQLAEIDISCGLVAPEEVVAMRKRQAPELRLSDYDGMLYLMVNTSKAPLTSPLVRRALDRAIDRHKLTRLVLPARERPARSILPESVTTAKPPGHGFDPAAAKTLLEEAGYGASKPLPPLEITFNTNSRLAAIGEFLQRGYKESLGIEVKLRNVEWKTYLDMLGSGEYQLGLMSLGGFDAIDFLNVLRSDLPEPNRARWKSSEYDALVKEAIAAPTLEKQDEVIGRILGLLDREMPQIGVFQLKRTALVRPGLAGYEAVPDNLHPIRWMRWVQN